MPFEKGVSGNPGGRPKAKARIVDLAREQTEASILTLVEVRDNKGAADTARVAAANALLDRGWGKPTQPISGDDEMPAVNITTVALTGMTGNGNSEG